MLPFFTSVVSSPNQENSGVIRVDHRFNDRDSMYGRYSIDDGTSTSALNNLAQASNVSSRMHTFVLEEVQNLSPGNYGIRYNFFGPFHEAQGNDNLFSLSECGGYCGLGTNCDNPNYLSIDPRLAVAYAPLSLGGNTVLRAGIGIYHGEVQLGDQDSPVVNTEPSTQLTSNASTIYSYPSTISLIPTTGLATTPRSMLLRRGILTPPNGPVPSSKILVTSLRRP